MATTKQGDSEKDETPVKSASTSGTKTTVSVKTLQRFDDWSLVMSLDTPDDYRVVGRALYGEHDVLPSTFEMTLTDWGKATKPADLGKALNLPADLALSVNIGAWRRGRVRNDQPITQPVIDGIMARLQRELSKRIDAVQPKEDESS